MTDFRLRLIIETILKDEKLLKTLKRDLEGIDTSAKKGSSGLKGFVDKISAMKGQIIAAGAILVGFGLAVKKAFDFSLQGAEVITLTESFTGLMERLGVGTSLLEELRAAAKGTIPDFELMSSTMTLIMGATGGLQDSLLQATPQLLEMAKAANKLNPALGSTTFLYESLARGIKRASPLILDNLGVIIKVGEAYSTYAESIGKTIDELTAADKTQAVLVAALEAGIPLIEQAGGTTEAFADTWRVLTTDITNATNAFLAWLAKGAEPTIGAFDLMLFGAGKLEDAFRKSTLEVIASKNPYEDYITSVTGMATALGKTVVTQEEYNALIIEGTTNQATLRNMVVLLSKEERNRQRSVMFLTQAMLESKKALLDFENAAEGTVEDEIRLKEEAENAAKALDDLKESIENANKAFIKAREEFSKDPFSNIETDILGRIEGIIQAFDFALVGGQLIADLATAVNTALFDERITEAQAAVFWDSLRLAAINVEIELGNLSLEDAAIDLAKTLGIDPAIAEQLLTDAIPVEAIVDNLDTAIQDTAETLLRLEDRVSQGLPGAEAALDSFLSGMSEISETASTMKSTIAEEFGLAEEDIDLVAGAFERLQEKANLSEQEIIEVKAAIDALVNKKITITIDYVTINAPSTPGGQAHGFHQVIPPGYPNDSYFLPLNVQSGEVVTVTPQGRTPAASPGGETGEININAPIYINSEANLSLEEMVNAAIPRYNI